MADVVAGEVETVDHDIDDPEPWEGWETRLCLWSIGLGIVGLVILGVLINIFILP